MQEMLFTIDPGDNTAIVLWDNKTPELVEFFSLKVKEKKLSIADRQLIIIKKAKEFFEECLHFDLSTVDTIYKYRLVIEGVSLWGGSTKSNTAAARGDSFRLAYLVGGLITIFQEVFGDNSIVEVVDVRTWKGSLPTDVLIKHVTSFIGEKPENEHIACAIGIGMHKFGRL